MSLVKQVACTRLVDKELILAVAHTSTISHVDNAIRARPTHLRHDATELAGQTFACSYLNNPQHEEDERKGKRVCYENHKLPNQ